MKNKLRVHIIQSDLAWENPGLNLQHFSERLEECGESELVVLPETFTTGFTRNISIFGDRDETVLGWMKKEAGKHNTHLAGSALVCSDGKCYNRLYLVSPGGDFQFYDKRHLFGPGGEKEAVSGDRRVVVRIGKFRILLQICYDLRFPVFSRNQNDYDAIIYSVNWPAPRQEVMEILSKARAIENQAYVILANRVGTDGENIAYLGGSALIDPKGIYLAKLNHKPGLVSALLNLEELNMFRRKFPVWEDADDFSLQL